MTSLTTTEKIREYYEEALESIPHDHPHKDEIEKLLLDQVNDDLSQSNAYTRTNR